MTTSRHFWLIYASGLAVSIGSYTIAWSLDEHDRLDLKPSATRACHAARDPMPLLDALSSPHSLGRTCACQLETRSRAWTREDDLLTLAKQEAATLEDRIDSPDSFSDAREALSQIPDVRSQIQATQRRRDRLRGETASESFWERVLLFSGILAGFFACRFLLNESRAVFGLWGDVARATPHVSVGRLSVLCAAITSIHLGASLLSQYLTSVAPIQKTWFGWNSFCINPQAFWMIKVTDGGVALSLAPAFALLVILTDKARAPVVAMQHVDGRCGIGAYVDFLQRWSFLGLALVVVPSVFWLTVSMATPDAELAYAIPAAVPTACVLLVILRGVLRARELRRAYLIERSNLGSTWSAIQAQAPPSDPTADFLGPRWWAMPAAIPAVLGTAWAAIKLLGLGALTP